MPRRLLIKWDDLTLFDGDVEELVFTDNDQGVTVQGRLKRAPTAGGLLDLFASAAKPKPKENADG